MTRDDTTLMAPLRRVEEITVSAKQGKALDPHYFWLTREYQLGLECGHVQVRARCAWDGPQPEALRPALPMRVRCAECQPVRRRRHFRGSMATSSPTFDPLVGSLARALYQLAPEQQDELLRWVDRHGRYLPNPALRSHAHAVVALAAVDLYLPHAHDRYAPAVRQAITTWGEDPTTDRRAEIRRAARRLYDAQHRAGNWLANRGIICAATITSPHPHNTRAVVECLTWDSPDRIGPCFQTGWPWLSEPHLVPAWGLLRAYQTGRQEVR